MTADECIHELECILGLDAKEKEDMEVTDNTTSEVVIEQKGEINQREITPNQPQTLNHGICQFDLEAKIRALEKEKIDQKDKLDKLRADLEAQKGKKIQTVTSRLGELPLGFVRDQFLSRDLKSAAKYIAVDIAPRLRRVLEAN